MLQKMKLVQIRTNGLNQKKSTTLQNISFMLIPQGLRMEDWCKVITLNGIDQLVKVLMQEFIPATMRRGMYGFSTVMWPRKELVHSVNWALEAAGWKPART